jgi:glycosyltransferase involved in cell wall biosynthesis
LCSGKFGVIEPVASPFSRAFMHVTIAICTFNHTESLKQTLAALNRVNVPRDWHCELLLIDNASTDQTAEVIRSFQPANGLDVHYLHEPRTGQCFARNTALQAAKGDIILFTDDDARVPENWIQGMCEPILAGKTDAVAGGIRIAPHLERPWMTWLHKSLWASTEFMDRDNPESLIGANMGFSREVLGKVPGFDTELGPGALGFHDESLFSFQLREAGYRISSAFDVVVEHHFDESRLQRSELIETTRKMGASSAYRMYHWEYNDIAHPRAQAALWRARLFKWRATREKWAYDEGMPEWETWMLWQYYTNSYYLIERKRPRNYERHGLVKLNQNQNVPAQPAVAA